MKSIVVFFGLIAFSFAAHAGNAFYYAGTTNQTGAPTSLTALPATITGGVCATGATASGYQVFTINATNPNGGFYYITAVFSYPMYSTGQIQTYANPFNPAAPCTGIRQVQTGSSYGPHVALLEYFATPGLYDVVVTSTDPDDAGYFGVHADPARWNGGTNDATSNWWTRPSYGYDYCTTSGSDTAYTSFSFSITETGDYDILVFAYNDTETEYIEAVLFNETSPSFIGTGNETNPVDPCVTSYNTFVRSEDEETSLSKVYQDNYAASIFYRYALTAGNNYTVVMSPYYSYANFRFGVYTRKSVGYSVGTTENYLTPDYSAPCTAGTTGYAWRANIATSYGTIVADNGYTYEDYMDSVLCLYRGLNTGSADQVTPPTPCPVDGSWIDCNDTPYPMGHSNGITENYTAITSDYYTATGTDNQYSIWAYSGTQLGVASTGGGSTTGADLTTASAFSVTASLALILAALFF